MMKWLLLAVVVVAVLWWLGRGRRGGSNPSRQASSPASPPSQAKAPEAMVACAHCGVLLPQGDALAGPVEGQHFCSEAHRRAGPRAS